MADDGIFEIAQMKVRAGEKEAFAEAAKKSLEIIAAAPGCRSVRFFDCIEEEAEPIFFVNWDRVEDHTNFRESESFAEYRSHVAPFFAETPAARHYLPQGSVGSY
jgi:heme-degrading monooxygenase HmoA